MKMKLEKAEIFYEQYGTGIPLIFLHGFHIDHKIFSLPLEKILHEQDPFCRIYPDLPGMGKTLLEKRINSTEELFHILLQFVDAVTCGRDFAIASYSYGSYLARGLVKARTDRIKGIFFLCPVIIPEHASRKTEEFRIFSRDNNFLDTLTEKERNIFCRYTIKQTAEVYKRVKKELMEPFKLADKQMLKKLQQDSYPFDEPVDNLNIGFDGPVQFLAGKQDSIVGYKDIFSIFEDYPNGEITILNGAGHSLQIERETAFSRIFRDWMKRVLYHLN